MSKSNNYKLVVYSFNSCCPVYWVFFGRKRPLNQWWLAFLFNVDEGDDDDALVILTELAVSISSYVCCSSVCCQSSWRKPLCLWFSCSKFLIMCLKRSLRMHSSSFALYLKISVPRPMKQCRKVIPKLQASTLALYLTMVFPRDSDWKLYSSVISGAMYSLEPQNVIVCTLSLLLSFLVPRDVSALKKKNRWPN